MNTEHIWHVWGPPGTGKTTYLSKQIEAAVETHGSDAVLVCSLTKAAAAELVGRKLTVDRDRIGTLHAHCYRALNHPQLVADKIAEWNASTFCGPYKLTDSTKNLDDDVVPPTTGSIGDDTMARLDLLRARCVPESEYPAQVGDLSRRWTQWKDAEGLYDFTDLIETCLRDCQVAPGAPRIIFGDEQQDSSRLELALLTQWSQHAQQVVLAHDIDQSIYAFRGATPEALLDMAIPPDRRRVLKQSYRVPRAVHALATRWIAKVARREVGEYLPRDADGYVKQCSATWRTPGAMMARVERNMADRRTTMILTSCGFMLGPILKELRKRSIPFHNPYRRAQGAWNPLARGATVDKLLAFLRPEPSAWGDQARMWSMADLKKWVPLLSAEGALQRGAKARITEADDKDQRELTINELLTLFTESALSAMMDDVTVKWLYEHCVGSKRSTLEYPVSIINEHGLQAIRQEPVVVVGTIHSVKGG